ncbi:hypothetical protein THASP1DRAFT_28046 [Thamnocephalis sphaerospora]|uniref:Short-chain dehydrogenase n=1 Tax=Thamnocephalis sphaerospora TaxID=78915 RepID=A0A4P9XWY3_9FUNG|nr:hypothetical protein THASP1DRAFT_28046 [Thamnocephalis sphaerospora]|eukprot:RKP10171.1 hypothetical protein THASP1DRAFT_28046 [Thamnocephalis sphaerospora]
MTVLLITGASRGIGYACVLRALSLPDVRVFGVARSSEHLAALAETAGQPDRFAWFAGDVTDRAVCARILDECLNRFGRLDAVIQNAGTLQPIAKIADADVDAWRSLFEINFFSVLELTRLVLPELRKSKGAIVMVSSGAANYGYTAWGAYGSSKAALKHLTMTLTAEETDVTAMGLSPGRVDTEMQAVLRAEGKAAMDPSDYQSFKEAKETGQLVKPEDCARSLVALAVGGRGGSWRGFEGKWNERSVQQLAAQVFGRTQRLDMPQK